jgi:hypothetical protein
MTMIGLGTGDDHEVWFRESLERRDAGGDRMLDRAEFGVDEVGRP